MADPLNYIGIARKAGAIEIGETDSGAAVRGGKARLLMLASDASDNARRRAENFIYGRKTPMIVLPYTKDELCTITGVNGCSMAAFTDVGLAAAFLEKLAENDPSFADAAAALADKNKKTLQRRKEAQAHEKKIKLGKPAHSGASEKRRKK